MSNVLIGIIGVILFIGLALAGALYLGDRFQQADNDAKAARFLNEGAQIAHAYELYGTNEGGYPSAATSEEKIDELVTTGYLKSKPVGGGAGAGDWTIDETTGTAVSLIGTDQEAQRICTAARQKMGFSGPVKLCTDPTIETNDPCCTAP